MTNKDSSAMTRYLTAILNTLAIAIFTSLVGALALKADTDRYGVDCTTSPDHEEHVQIDIESETVYVGDCELPIENLNYQGISDITDKTTYIWNSIGRNVDLRSQLLSGRFSIMDYFILTGNLESIEILLELGYKPDQGDTLSLELLLRSLSWFDSGFLETETQRSDYAAMMEILIDNYSDIDFEYHEVTFIESFIMSFCSTRKYEDGDLSKLTLSQINPEIDIGRNQNIDKIKALVELDLYDSDCVSQLNEYFRINY